MSEVTLFQYFGNGYRFSDISDKILYDIVESKKITLVEFEEVSREIFRRMHGDSCFDKEGFYLRKERGILKEINDG